MRTPFVAANWKMHKTAAEATAFATAFRARMETMSGAEVVVAPPFTALHAVAAALDGSRVGVAGQNLHAAPQGAYTGEVSAGMLLEAGAGYVIIGHSERRQLFGETDATVNAKLHAALGAGLVPIVCVGETLDERDSGRMFPVLNRQIAGALADIDSTGAGSIVMAYEPVWAIGTGRNALPAQAQEAHAHIRQRIARALDADSAAGCRIIYGGSVKPGNAGALAAEPDVDGALVGGAGLDPDSFAEIVAQNAAAAV
ncbi:MAG: triose-phosphate isomerase [Acidobacteria bacterium]|nr:triose-phosphate isomerase [Acidobacteriota bacterium]